jgi:hypothetical protein
MLGAANQLKSNPIVFDKLKRGFLDSMKKGNLSDDLAGRINQNLALTFGEGADIRNPKIWREADTFEKRAALADVMMGQGIAPGKGGVALGGEKSGKGVIFKPTDILKRETEPSLLHSEYGGGVPTYAAGPRLFKIGKESEYRPDLHPGFPTLLRGEDLGINMMPTPTEVYLPDWHAKFKKANPDRAPGYYDLSLGVKGEGLPSQEINDAYIRHLMREGYAEGGSVNSPAIYDPSLIDEIVNSIDEPTGYAGGGIVKGLAKLGKKLVADSDVLPAAERDANLAKFLEGNKAPPTVYHSTSKDFNQFSSKKLGQNTKHPTTKLGFFTAANPASTEDFISSTSGVSKGLYESGANIMPLHVSIKNPYEIPSTKYLLQSMALQNMKKKDADKYVQDFVDSLKAEGHDGLLIKANPKGLAGGNEFSSDNWVAFEPTQIKSATGNRGTYDINEPDLNKAHGGSVRMAQGGSVSAYDADLVDAIANQFM